MGCCGALIAFWFKVVKFRPSSSRCHPKKYFHGSMASMPWMGACLGWDELESDERTAIQDDSAISFPLVWSKQMDLISHQRCWSRCESWAWMQFATWTKSGTVHVCRTAECADNGNTHLFTSDFLRRLVCPWALNFGPETHEMEDTLKKIQCGEIFLWYININMNININIDIHIYTYIFRDCFVLMPRCQARITRNALSATEVLQP